MRGGGRDQLGQLFRTDADAAAPARSVLLRVICARGFATGGSQALFVELERAAKRGFVRGSVVRNHR
jgi:uncharacterized protein YidB (DUF937 family)